MFAILLCLFVYADSPSIAIGQAHMKRATIGAGELTKLGILLKHDLEILDFFSIKQDGELKLKETMTNHLWHVELLSQLKPIFSMDAAYDEHPDTLVRVSHQMADMIIQKITGKKGIVSCKIAMTCEKRGVKEIYMMDIDGSHIEQVTHHHGIAFAPAWSPDGQKLAYSLFTRHKDHTHTIDLYEFDFQKSSVRLLSSKPGINSGAVYAPNGKTIVLTMSLSGNPELYELNPETKQSRKITRTPGFDVDPNFSPDGSTLAFVSSRSGAPMIFTTKLDGSELARLTFAGKYNASPSWSPTGDKIAFAGWLEKGFDIFLMNPDGSSIERITKNQGNNEDPSMSPDGRFIALSSNRTGKKNIYITNGTFTKRLTYGFEGCTTPKWSPPLH